MSGNQILIIYDLFESRPCCMKTYQPPNLFFMPMLIGMHLSFLISVQTANCHAVLTPSVSASSQSLCNPALTEGERATTCACIASLTRSPPTSRRRFALLCGQRANPLFRAVAFRVRTPLRNREFFLPSFPPLDPFSLSLSLVFSPCLSPFQSAYGMYRLC